MRIDIKNDLWTYLQQTSKKIVMYGMGNGADKILDVCESRGIEISDFFASDGFVRGHSFHGKTVISYSDAKQKYGTDNMIVLLSFASSLPDVLENIYKIASECELYAPDVPVFGNNLFDLEFFNMHRAEFEKAYGMLADGKSKLVFENTVKYKLTGNISYLIPTDPDKSDIYSNILGSYSFKNIADLGAYNGDTIRDILPFARNLKTVIAFEPDAHSVKKLTDYASTEGRCGINIINACAWSSDTKLEFDARGGRSAGVSKNSDAVGKPPKKVIMDAKALDNLTDGVEIDYIKYDVEGSERPALIGSERTIRRCKPCLLVSAYHRSEDLFDLPYLIKELMPDCRLYLRRTPYVPAWDLHLLAIPDRTYTVETERMSVVTSSISEILQIISAEPTPEMKQAYTEMLNGCITSPGKHKWYTVWKMILKNTDTVIGDLCFKGISDDGTVEIGYGIHPEYEGHGYMTEAVRAMVEWASAQPEVVKIQAETEADNIASQRVLEKSGFIPTGTLGEEGPRFVYNK